MFATADFVAVAKALQKSQASGNGIVVTTELTTIENNLESVRRIHVALNLVVKIDASSHRVVLELKQREAILLGLSDEVAEDDGGVEANLQRFGHMRRREFAVAQTKWPQYGPMVESGAPICAPASRSCSLVRLQSITSPPTSRGSSPSIRILAALCSMERKTTRAFLQTRRTSFRQRSCSNECSQRTRRAWRASNRCVCVCVCV